MFLSLRLAAFTSILFISHVFGLPLVKRDQLCNGHAELCDRSYGNTTFLGAHDSFAVSSNPFALSRTQVLDLEGQLDLGARMFQGQIHLVGSVPHFCHTSCALFDGGTVEDYFTKLHRYLVRHPNEVVTLILANPEELSVDDDLRPVFESSGLANISYVPSETPMLREDWPTLKEMLDSEKRVVVFIDKEAQEGTVEYILPQFDNMWEDAYDPTNANFPCKVDRTAGSLDPSQQLNLINHNLNVNIIPFGRGLRLPDFLDTPRTNSIKSILHHAESCTCYTDGNRPNFVLADFLSLGHASDAVDRLNGFTY